MALRDLRQHGLRLTVPRQSILELLSTAKQRHLSAEDIFRQLQAQQVDIALATIYRTLHQFEQAGLVIKHQFEGDTAVYELDDGEHHDHMVCVKCGLVQEFVDEVIERRQLELAKAAGFELTDHHLHLYGLCANCQRVDKLQE